MSYGDMRRFADSLGVAVCSRSLPGELEGFYHAPTNLIVIDRSMDYTMKRCTLTHELVHWSHGDSTCVPVIHTRIENRTRRETATLLVSPTDYALAETMYEGDVALIALELDVTEQVVKDYQRLVIPRLTHV
ncbi:hypothetical protein BMIN_0315 [Bifidobacterium minimum]|uniref:IrrE N-terminal-like domain-containing protein n=1 Tax=Bifidobacterium minimum TaxID=1693 RepID=A0A087BN20_9BIFI|nr:hypothetical protein BMIN_0315 [Bifidobacterium minimum]